MTIRIVLVLGLILALMSGCSKDVRDPDRQAGGIKPSPGQSASEAKSPREEASTDGPRGHGQVDIDYLKLNLKPGITQEQAVKLFGSGYEEVVHPEGGTRMWRYDYADVGYQFQAHSAGQRMGIAEADLSGLKRGMVRMQMFVGWDPATRTASYSELYYVVDRDGYHHVKLYTVYPDGNTTEQELPV